MEGGKKGFWNVLIPNIGTAESVKIGLKRMYMIYVHLCMYVNKKFKNKTERD